MVFPVVMYGCENWTIKKKAEHQRIDAFVLWGWRRLLRVPWTARRSNQSILKEISPEYSLEGVVLKLKLPILWWTDAKNWLTGKDPDAWERFRAGGEGDYRGWDAWMASPISMDQWISMDISFGIPWELVMDSDAWCAVIIHGVSKSQSWLSDWTALNWILTFSICDYRIPSVMSKPTTVSLSKSLVPKGTNVHPK